MPITISVNDDLALHVIHFVGQVAFQEIETLGCAHAENKNWAGADTIHILAEGADVSRLSRAQLDATRAHYRAVHQSIDFFLLRRSGWVCADEDARHVVKYWLRERHSRDGQGAELYFAATLDGLNELFSADELEAVRSAQGFAELLRVDHG